MPPILRIAVICTIALNLAAPSADAGYMHFFRWKSEPDPEALRACVAEMARVVEASTDIVAGTTGEGPPMLAPVAIEFNGKGEDRHMPFQFPGMTPAHLEDEMLGYVAEFVGFNACDTQYRPHDAVVVACLLVARDHFPPNVLEIGSDGSWEAGDLKGGAELYERVYQRAAKNPISTDKNPTSAEFWMDDDSGLPWWIAIIVLVIVLGIVWKFVGPQDDFVIRASPRGLECNDGVSGFEREQIRDFLEKSCLTDRRLTIAGRRRDNSGHLALRIRGRLSTGDRQRLRNFLVSLM